ncbi:MAG: DUF4340 domain-containing protein [Anaerolineae bacterium]|nr:DUF4340 domain-containing protein [Anaerolineae bacterium]
MNRRSFSILVIAFVTVLVVAALQNRPPAPLNPSATLSQFNLLGQDLNIQTADIQAIRLRDPKSNISFVISRDINGIWTAPEWEGSLDVNTASDIAKTVSLMPYQSTVPISASTNLTGYGFSPEGFFSVEVLLTNQAGHVIAIGNLIPTGGAYYGLVDDRQEIYLLERGPVDYLVTQLIKPPLT